MPNQKGIPVSRTKARRAPRKRAKENGQRDPWATARREIPIFPTSLREPHLHYYDYGQTLLSSAGLATTRFFSANGLYDPDITGTGHQPMGFDQLMLFYEQATVLNSSITVTFIGLSQASRVAVYLSPDTTNITDPIRLAENGLMATDTVDSGVLSAVAGGGGGAGTRIKRVTFHCDVAKYFGRPKGRGIINDPDLYCTVAANPVEQVYFGVAVWNCFDQATAGSAEYDVLIEYDAVFFEPRKLTVS